MHHVVIARGNVRDNDGFAHAVTLTFVDNKLRLDGEDANTAMNDVIELLQESHNLVRNHVAPEPELCVKYAISQYFDEVKEVESHNFPVLPVKYQGKTADW